jgi:hypothetical protein
LGDVKLIVAVAIVNVLYAVSSVVSVVVIMDIESNTRMLSTMNDPMRMGRVTGGAVCDCLANTVAAPGVLLRQLLVVVTVLEKISWCCH